jgi:hypothetical protein
MMIGDGEMGNDIMGDQPRCNRTVVNRHNGYGCVFDTASKGVTSSKTVRNTRSGGTTINKREGVNRASVGEGKANGDKEV